MPNIKLTIAYDGANYHGWQRQFQLTTIQEVLETKLALINKAPITLHGSGRTDAGVHAFGQVANFRTSKQHSPWIWQKALNHNLPPDIAISAVEEVDEDFHARHCAVEKHYRYRALLSKHRWPFENNYAWHIPWPLDLKSMQEAAAFFVGEHDFNSFRGSGCEAESSVRELKQLSLNLNGNILEFNLIADGFLRYMVRNIVGTLVWVGSGRFNSTDIPKILAACDRTQAGPTAPPGGLFLMSVKY